MKTSNFSLTELLVVFALLAILISLLQPSLKKTFIQANKVHCLNNLKQQGTALAVFINDNEGKFPALPQWISLNGKLGKSTAYQSNKMGIDDRVLNPYLNNDPNASYCPSDIGDSHPQFKDKINSCFDEFGTSYLPAAYGNWSRVQYVFGYTKTTSKSIYELSPLSNKLILADWPWHWNRPVADAKTRWHDGDISRKLNVLFADGHAAYIDFTLEWELAPNLAPQKTWLFW